MLFAFRNILLIVKKNRCPHLGTKALSRLIKQTVFYSKKHFFLVFLSVNQKTNLFQELNSIEQITTQTFIFCCIGDTKMPIFQLFRGSSWARSFP